MKHFIKFLTKFEETLIYDGSLLHFSLQKFLSSINKQHVPNFLFILGFICTFFRGEMNCRLFTVNLTHRIICQECSIGDYIRLKKEDVCIKIIRADRRLHKNL